MIRDISYLQQILALTVSRNLMIGYIVSYIIMYVSIASKVKAVMVKMVKIKCMIIIMLCINL